MFRTVRGHDYPPRYNIAPTKPVAIVRIGADGQRELALVRWGLIPGWVKQPDEFATLVNARAETAMDKPSFKAALRHRRCIVPADGYYEWTGKSGARRPHLIRPATDASLMGFAGLWEHWMGADGSEMETMVILTVPANARISPIHDRMPAILVGEAHDAWLDVRGVRGREALDLLKPAPDDLLTIDELAPAINDPRREGAELHLRAARQGN
jgi:putative SOS response-associated peptidase YedK